MRHLWWKRSGSARNEHDFDEEIRSHLAHEADRLVAEGMTPDDARAAAHRAFGSVTLVQERFYESRHALWLERLTSDLRYALRSLGKSPGFAAASLATLAFGIGLNTAIISLLYGVALRPLPLRDAGRVVNVYQDLEGHFGPREVRGAPSLVSYTEYAAYRDRNHTLAGLAVSREEELSLAGAQGAAPVRGLLVSCNYFHVLTVRMAAGRAFVPDECERPGGGAVAVLSHGFWRRAFGGDSAVLGRSVVLDGLPFSVIGIAERGFAGTSLGSADVFVPVTMHPALSRGRDSILYKPSASWLTAIGRLKPRVTAEQARADLAVIARQGDAEYPGRRTVPIVRTATYMNMPEMRRQGAVFAASLVAVAVLVVVMACANVTNLVLARAAARRREVAIRLALGSGRPRLVGQLLVESVVIALAGGAAGLMLAYWLPPLLLAAVPETGLHLDVSPDRRVLAYALLVSAATALAVGLVPALRATSLELTAALRGESTVGGRRASASRMRNAIVGVQVTGSVLLLAVAGLFVRALLHAQSVDPGFRVRDVAAISLDIERHGYDAARAAAVYDALQERLAALQGVASVARADHMPLTGIYGTDVRIEGAEGAPADSGQLVNIALNIVSGGYFATMGVPIIRGRAFDDAEARAAGTAGIRPAVVSEAMARRFWPSQPALGRRFDALGFATYEVVGVARDVRNNSLAGPDEVFAYLAARPDDPSGMRLVVRARPAPGALAAVMTTVPTLVRALDPDLLATTTPLEASVARVLEPARLASLLVSLIGALAVALALLGVYGVISYGVSQRTREIGVRLALGAPARHVVALVMRQGGGIVLAGVVIGLALAAGASQVIRGMLFGVSALDPLTYLGTAGVVATAALLAMYRPARRATRIDPAVTLRSD